MRMYGKPICIRLTAEMEERHAQPQRKVSRLV